MDEEVGGCQREQGRESVPFPIVHNKTEGQCGALPAPQPSHFWLRLSARRKINEKYLEKLPKFSVCFCCGLNFCIFFWIFCFLLLSSFWNVNNFPICIMITHTHSHTTAHVRDAKLGNYLWINASTQWTVKFPQLRDKWGDYCIYFLVQAGLHRSSFRNKNISK